MFSCFYDSLTSGASLQPKEVHPWCWRISLTLCKHRMDGGRTLKSTFPWLGLTPDTRRRHSHCISSAPSSLNRKPALAQTPALRRGAARDQRMVRVQQKRLSGMQRTNIMGCQCCRGTGLDDRMEQIHVRMPLHGPLRVNNPD